MRQPACMALNTCGDPRPHFACIDPGADTLMPGANAVASNHVGAEGRLELRRDWLRGGGGETAPSSPLDQVCSGRAGLLVRQRGRAGYVIRLTRDKVGDGMSCVDGDETSYRRRRDVIQTETGR